MNVSRIVKSTILWRGWCIWQRNRDAFLRSWKIEVSGIAIEPVIMLLGVGFGLGVYIGELGGQDYAKFLAPGVIAAYAMFHATFDSTFGAYMRMETNNVYESVLFTPLGPSDIVVGEVMWAASRGALSGTSVLVVAAVLGLISSPYAILAVPAAYLIGFAIGAIAIIFTSLASSIGALTNFFTLFIMPMFYLSGVFFPLEHLPYWVRIASWAMPLTPSVALVRGLVQGDLSWLMLVWVFELLAVGLLSLIIGCALMRRRLIT